MIANASPPYRQAKSLVRDGSADWILLKRGDVWQETFGVWDLSGRSAGERIVIDPSGVKIGRTAPA